MFDIGRILIMVPPFLFAITVHEFAHGWMALRKGDPTARDAGRLTLNPLYHLDLFGTIMLLLVGFGWAKPVPVNPYNLRDPIKDGLWISLAGPAANLLSAFFFGMIIRLVGLDSVSLSDHRTIYTTLIQMLIFAMQINIILAVFNLLPIPPLDGSGILRGLLPRESLGWYYQYERYGQFLLMGIIMLGFVTGINVFGMFFQPFLVFFSRMFAGF